MAQWTDVTRTQSPLLFQFTYNNGLTGIECRIDIGRM